MVPIELHTLKELIDQLSKMYNAIFGKNVEILHKKVSRAKSWEVPWIKGNVLI